ncbi:hypothetical protein GWI33_000932 [Rhynchophorus ferrugineus]|uniref:Uncharacterized protein n=1 Tax=Rhynchophorus ferrugineus TaxID=354439 RepID=A0A834M189_RHYFE|nr:hypothetical protein GWI33_000932 [Rhynchophorus ferrugineus]
MDHATTSNNEQTPTTQSNDIPAPTSASTKKARVPPIILRDKNAYSKLIRILTFQGIQFGSTQTKPEGVAFFPPTPDDYRMIINVLNDRKYGQHTFYSPVKRHLRTIIKGVLESILTNEVRSALMKLGFNLIHVKQWKTKRGKLIADCVQVIWLNR